MPENPGESLNDIGYTELYWFIYENYAQMYGLSQDEVRQLASEYSQQDFTGVPDEVIINGISPYLGNYLSKREKTASEMAIYKSSVLPEEEYARQQKQIGESLALLKAREYDRSAAFEGQEMEKQRREAASGYLAGLPTVAQSTAPIISGARSAVSPSAERYYASRLPELYSQLGMAKQRSDYGTLVTQGIMRGGVEPRRAGEKSRAEQVIESDPWAQYLKKIQQNGQLINEFKSLTPRERGYYSGILRPRTRTLR